ncbi:MAG TPA: hypothetical protein DER09_13525 [Prolixibacteraceae bacterium]|nr:hypothetical protein [Prolixibacteraceae bacterium]
MKRYLILIATVAAGTMISCAPAQKESKQEAVQQLKQVQQTTLSVDTTAAVPTVPAAVTSQPAAVQTTSTPPELNPPHGQPYHRCDIPVGSPLNAAASPRPTQSKPAANVVRTGTSPTLENAARLNNPQAVNPTAPTLANATGEKPKLNPPHGQPYHRCDIAVGSPLP